jgi:hypothetical protein
VIVTGDLLAAKRLNTLLDPAIGQAATNLEGRKPRWPSVRIPVWANRPGFPGDKNPRNSGRLGRRNPWRPSRALRANQSGRLPSAQLHRLRSLAQDRARTRRSRPARFLRAAVLRPPRQQRAGILYLMGDSDRIGSSHPAIEGILVLPLPVTTGDRRPVAWLGPGCGCFCSEQSQGPSMTRSRIGQDQTHA